MDTNRIRRIFFYGLAAAYALTAATNLWDTQGGAALAGFELTSAGGLSEYRAVYVGMFSALAVASFVAARRPELVVLGDLVALTLAGAGLGRLLSFAIDGVPAIDKVAHLGLESLGVLILLARPRATGDEHPALAAHEPSTAATA